MRKLFGTDGIRGTANTYPITAEMALRLGMAAGSRFKRGNHRHTVVIGKDTRLSGYMIQPALTAGFSAVGIDVVLLGPLPTPAVASLTRSMRADLGVMISASHNPYYDTGIKLFGPDGYKLSDAAEAEIERLMSTDLAEARVGPGDLGRVRKLDDATGRYIEFVKNAFPRGLRLDGLKIVVDCANGAAYKAAPTVLWELGAEVVPMAVKPDGFNINDGCGSSHPEGLRAAVLREGAHLGLALDGDADRLILCDETGAAIDGDQILALIAETWAGQGRLKGAAVVATVMSNLGLERHLATRGIGLIRTKVGDRYVVEEMRRSGCNLGGEQSGHVVLGDHATTGDGLAAALQVLAAIVEGGGPASAIARRFRPLPQKLQNVRVGPQINGHVVEDESVVRVIRDSEMRLAGCGRLLIRRSGTEPVVRVMAEGEDEVLIGAIVQDIVSALQAAAR
jgi:phosphoglucosamine mutase